MMRRILTITGLLLALGCVGCDPNDPKVDAANRAVDEGSGLPGWLGDVFGLAGVAMSAFGIRRANVGNAYVKSPVDLDDLNEFKEGLRKYPEMAAAIQAALAESVRTKGAS